MINPEPAEQISFDYHFSEREVKALARFFRKNQEQLPSELAGFAMKIERVIYNSLLQRSW